MIATLVCPVTGILSALEANVSSFYHESKPNYTSHELLGKLVLDALNVKFMVFICLCVYDIEPHEKLVTDESAAE